MYVCGCVYSDVTFYLNHFRDGLVVMSLTRDLSLLKDNNISNISCMYVRVHVCGDESDKRSFVVERQ